VDRTQTDVRRDRQGQLLGSDEVTFGQAPARRAPNIAGLQKEEHIPLKAWRHSSP
jgi:hypothetical protein